MNQTTKRKLKKQIIERHLKEFPLLSDFSLTVARTIYSAIAGQRIVSEVKLLPSIVSEVAESLGYVYQGFTVTHNSKSITNKTYTYYIEPNTGNVVKPWLVIFHSGSRIIYNSYKPIYLSLTNEVQFDDGNHTFRLNRNVIQSWSVYDED